MEMSSEEIIAIYHQRWEIELLLKQPYLTMGGLLFQKETIRNACLWALRIGFSILFVVLA